LQLLEKVHITYNPDKESKRLPCQMIMTLCTKLGECFHGIRRGIRDLRIALLRWMEGMESITANSLAASVENFLPSTQ